MSRTVRLNDIDGLLVSDVPGSVDAFKEKRVGMLIIPLDLGTATMNALKALSPELAIARGQEFGDTMSLPKDGFSVAVSNEQAVDWASAGYIRKLRLGSKGEPSSVALMHDRLAQGLRAVCGKEASAAGIATAVEVTRRVASLFNELSAVAYTHNYADLGITFGFGAYCGVPPLPMDSRDVNALRAKAGGNTLENDIRIDFSLSGSMGHVLAGNIAKTDWRTPQSWTIYNLDTVHNLQQDALRKVGGAKIPFPAIVLSRQTENAPVLMGPMPDSTTRSITGHGNLRSIRVQAPQVGCRHGF